MICGPCATGADLFVAAVPVFSREEPDPWYGTEGLDGETGALALCVAAAVNHLHEQCNGCDCQHGRTALARSPQ
jgi:hypothetical protein